MGVPIYGSRCNVDSNDDETETARLDYRPKRGYRQNRFQAVTADGYRKQTATPQHDQLIAMEFDDAAFIDAGMLSIGDRFFLRSGAVGCLGQARGWRRSIHRLRIAFGEPLVALAIFGEL